jgi:UDP:flavonoid glycosyltransferase YjiC (YdhE family)
MQILIMTIGSRGDVQPYVALGKGLKQAGAATNYPELFKLGYAPHQWLFQRVAMVIHHGGSGTTNCGLWAGVPSLIIPFGGDQFYWGERVKALGVGPAPISKKQLTALKLAEAINQGIGDKEMKYRAAELGKKLRAEDSIGQAVQIFQRYAKS